MNRIKHIKLAPLKGYNAFSSHFPGGKRFFHRDLMMSVVFTEDWLAETKLAGDSATNSISYIPTDVAGDIASDNTPNQATEYLLRYGVSVRKKVCPKAVVRNRIKRLLRESLRARIRSINNSAKIADDLLPEPTPEADNLPYLDCSANNVRAKRVDNDNFKLESVLKWESVLFFYNKRIEKPSLLGLNEIDRQAEHLFDKAIAFTIRNAPKQQKSEPQG